MSGEPWCRTAHQTIRDLDSDSEWDLDSEGEF